MEGWALRRVMLNFLILEKRRFDSHSRVQRTAAVIAEEDAIYTIFNCFSHIRCCLHAFEDDGELRCLLYPGEIFPAESRVYVGAHQSTHTAAFLVVARYRAADGR